MTRPIDPEPAEVRRPEVVATFKNVTAAFDSYQVRALSDVSLSVRRGEVFAVLGGKGSGKSTLLRLLAGKLVPADGSVRVFGRSPGATRPRIGYLAGRPAPGTPSGWRRWLGWFSNPRPPGAEPPGEDSRLSEARRAQLRQAVLGNRELIVLDDAFEGLDNAGREEIKALISELAARGKTIVLGAKSLRDVRDSCDRLCILHEGKLQAVGTLEELLTHPEAVRFLAPVLSLDLKQQLLSAIRQEFSTRGNSKAPSGSPGDQVISEAETTSVSTGGQTAPSAATSREEDVNYPRLDALTKTAAHPPGSTGEGGNSQ